MADLDNVKETVNDKVEDLKDSVSSKGDSDVSEQVSDKVEDVREKI